MTWRPPLTDATREQLVAVMKRDAAPRDDQRDEFTPTIDEVRELFVLGWDEEGARGDFDRWLELLAVAILAEFRPVASTRERLARHFDSEAFEPGPRDEPSLSELRERVEAARAKADRLLASGAVEDRAEVEAKALEAAASMVEAHRWDTTDDTAAAIRARAVSIREGRS